MKTELKLQGKYTVVTGDRRSFVGVYVGLSRRNGYLIFQKQGLTGADVAITEVEQATTVIAGWREAPPRLHRSQFGKTHLALLVHLEERVVWHSGQLDPNLLRCNPLTHKGLVGRSPRPWDGRSGTLLRGKPDFIRGYDDYDCLKDLIEQGLVTRGGTPERYWLTPNGWDTAWALRKHLSESKGTYDGFNL